MKAHILLLIIFSMLRINSYGHDSPLDVPIHITKTIDIFNSIDSMRATLSQQEAVDLEGAAQRLMYHCNAAVRIGLSEQEGDALFLGLVNNHTPRQIILIAAALALAESAPNTDPHRSVPGDAPVQYALRLKSEGIGFVRTYACAAQAKITEINQKNQPDGVDLSKQ